MEENALALQRNRPSLKRRGDTFNILTIDGGGLRGLIPAIILERLSSRFPRLVDAFDMIAGTSSGAILGASLAVSTLGPDDHTAAALAKELPPSAVRAVLEVTFQKYCSVPSSCRRFSLRGYSLSRDYCHILNQICFPCCTPSSATTCFAGFARAFGVTCA